MRHLVISSAFAVLLASSSAHAGSVCIQNDSTPSQLMHVIECTPDLRIP